MTPYQETYRGSVRPGEVDGSNRLGLVALVHRLSTAAVQCQAHMGLTPELMRELRLGFSTFEFQMAFPGRPPGVGEAVEVKSTIAHVGTSSVRMLHRMERAAGGEVVVILGQMGVNLDLDARRPAPLPPEVADLARSLMSH